MAQEAFEVKYDRMLDTLEESMTKRQDLTEQKTESKFFLLFSFSVILLVNIFNDFLVWTMFTEWNTELLGSQHYSGLGCITFLNIFSMLSDETFFIFFSQGFYATLYRVNIANIYTQCNAAELYCWWLIGIIFVMVNLNNQEQTSKSWLVLI